MPISLQAFPPREVPAVEERTGPLGWDRRRGFADQPCTIGRGHLLGSQGAIVEARFFNGPPEVTDPDEVTREREPRTEQDVGFAGRVGWKVGRAATGDVPVAIGLSL